MFLFDRAIALGDHGNFKHLTEKKGLEKDCLNSLQSCVYVRPLYGVVH